MISGLAAGGQEKDVVAVCGTDRRRVARAWEPRCARVRRGGLEIVNHNFADANGLPSGKVGLAASAAGTVFGELRVADDSLSGDLLGRWRMGNPDPSVKVSGGKFFLGGYGTETCPPYTLRNFRGEKFRATFSAARPSGSSSALGYFAFDIRDPHDYSIVQLYHNASGNAPYAREIIDGNDSTLISSTRDSDEAPDAADTDTLWYRVTANGASVEVKCIKQAAAPSEQNWTDANACMTSTAFPCDGGGLGFGGGNLYIDDMTVEGWDDSAWVVQAVEAFTTDANGHAGHRPAHDEAGSMVYDGQYQYTFDAWNRLAKVERAWRDDANTVIQTGSTIAEIQYDGLHRRTIKKITNSGDWDATYRYTWSTNWQLLETRNGDGKPIKQHLWGPRYIDEIVQIAVNTDPETDANCESAYYPMQNANFNVLGVADANGVLVERYEYTPYGQRRVYTKAGANDPLTTAPLYDSQPASENHPHSICDLGHQGLMHDREFGLIYNRLRYADPEGRWGQRDPGGYLDGMNQYLYELAAPVHFNDPFGMEGAKTVHSATDPLNWSADVQLYLQGQVEGILPAEQARYKKLNVTDPAEARRHVVSLVRDWRISWQFQCLFGWDGKLSINEMDGVKVSLAKETKDPFGVGNWVVKTLGDRVGINVAKTFKADLTAKMSAPTKGMYAWLADAEHGLNKNALRACRVITVQGYGEVIYEGEIDFKAVLPGAKDIPAAWRRFYDLGKKVLDKTPAGVWKGKTVVSRSAINMSFLICCHCDNPPTVGRPSERAARVPAKLSWFAYPYDTAITQNKAPRELSGLEAVYLLPGAIIRERAGKSNQVDYYVGDWFKNIKGSDGKVLPVPPELKRNDGPGGWAELGVSE